MNTRILFFLLICFYTHAEAPQAPAPTVPTAQASTNSAPGESELQAARQQKSLLDQLGAKYEAKIPFVFERKPLIDIINAVVTQKGANVVLPQRQAELDLLKRQTVTYTPTEDQRVTLSEAWRLLLLFLDMTGFSIVAKKPNLYTVVRNGVQPNEPSVTREPLPLFVSTKPDKLPLGDERIRYIYYLRNLRVPQPAEAPRDPLTDIFREMLSPTALQGPGNIPVIYEPKSNGFLLVDKASNIASVMRIIAELDATGFSEVIEVLPLFNVPAQDVRAVFDTLRRAAGEGADRASPFIRSDPRTEAVSYFAADTRIIADPRTNSLVLMGRETAVSRIREFIELYVDTVPESGESILHYYDLQYLDSEAFALVLQGLVAPLAPAGAQATAQGPVGGPERFFQGVQVRAERYEPLKIRESAIQEVQLEQLGNVTTTGIGKDIVLTGGNRLVVAALRDDWLRLRDLIQQLDKPQPQVILEVLIVDFIFNDIRRLGATSRNPTDLPLPGSLEFLASHLAPVGSSLIIDPLTGIPPSPPNRPALAQDLLAPRAQGAPPNTINFLTGPGSDPSNVGSLIITVNDPNTPGIGLILQVLQRMSNARVVSHPFLVTTNNQKATIANRTIRRAQGPVTSIGGGGVQINVEDVPATLQVQMWPHISSLDRLGLQIAVDVNDFIEPPPGLRRVTRRVNTHANLSSGQILVIGGLTRHVQIDNITETPFFSDIPLIGWLFKSVSKDVARTNLAVFIAPTIVQPKLRGGLNVYTADKIRKGRRDISDTYLFDNLQDPITRIFFKYDTTKNRIVREYLAQSSNAPEFEVIKTTRERRLEARRPTRPPTPVSQTQKAGTPQAPSKLPDKLPETLG